MRSLFLIFTFSLFHFCLIAQTDWKAFPSKDKTVSGNDKKTSSSSALQGNPPLPQDTNRLGLTSNNGFGEGVVDTIMDAGITDLLNRYVSDTKRPGYRIKIYSGRSSEEAKKAKERFTWKDRDTKVYTEWSPPNFAVKVGNYRSKLKALESHNKIKRRFRNAYIIEEWVEPQ